METIPKSGQPQKQRQPKNLDIKNEQCFGTDNIWAITE